MNSLVHERNEVEQRGKNLMTLKPLWMVDKHRVIA
jgi:hypothetical protein